MIREERAEGIRFCLQHILETPDKANKARDLIFTDTQTTLEEYREQIVQLLEQIIDTIADLEDIGNFLADSLELDFGLLRK